MRHLTLLSLFLLLCLGVVVATPENVPMAVEPAVAAEPGLGLESLQVEKITLQPLPEAPLIADAAADTCSNATTVTLNSSGVGETTTVNSMTEGTEDPVLTCAWGSPSRPQGYRTVWYKFTPESNGRVTIDTANNFNPNSYDTILAVYTGTCGAATLNMVACNDDYQGFASRVSFDVSQDETYYVEVADWNAAEPGPLELDIFFVLDPIPSKWVTLGTSAPARTHHATVKHNGLIYMVGGQTNATGTPMLSSSLYRYNPGLDSWTTLAPMPGDPLTDLTAAQLNGKIYVPGGYNGNSMVGTHHVYNIATGLWETDKPAPPVAVGWAQAVVPADQGGYYLVGGISNTDILTNTAVVHNDVSFFNGSSWNPATPDMIVPRYGHTAVWINNGICVVGGINDNNQLVQDGECYQPAGSGTWQTIAPMNIARYGAASAMSPDGRWYVFGGLGGNHEAVPEVEVYDPANPGAGWQLLDVTYDLGGSSITRARAFPQGEFLGNYLYAIGGHDTIDFFVTPLVQRLLALGKTLHLPVILNGNGSLNDNFSVAQRLIFNVAQVHQFNDSFDFFDAFYFDQPSTSTVTVRLSQIPSGSDYNVTVYDASKSVRGSGTLAGNQSEAVTLLLPAGRYYIMVERIFGQADGSNYRIIVEK
jgi:N-acetylneuraminic acid mutarotase